MIASDITRCFTLILIPIMYRFGGLTLSSLYLIVFVWSSAAAFFLPARTAIIPQIFPDKDQLTSANSLINSFFEATRLIGYAISGIFIIIFTAVGAASFDSMTFAISALAILSMGSIASPLIRKTRRQGTLREFHKDLAEGLNYVWKNFVIRIVLLTAMFGNFFIGIGYGFIVVFARQALHTNAIGYGLLLGASTIGTIAGSLLVGKVGFRKHLGMTLILSSIIMGVAIISLSLQTQLAAAIPFMVLFGLGIAIYNVNYVNMFQATVPNEILGRVMSLDQLISYAIIPLSLAVGGPFVDLIGIRAAYLISGGMVALIGASTFIPKQYRNFSY